MTSLAWQQVHGDGCDDERKLRMACDAVRRHCGFGDCCDGEDVDGDDADVTD